MATSKPEPAAERLYLEEMARRTDEVLGDELVGVYAGGSYALGGYVKGSSDLDVAVVTRGDLPGELRGPLVEALRQESLSCPARELELVVYRLPTARSGSATRDFELNLNTGEGIPLLIEVGPEAGGPTFWFPIDRSILAQAGVAVLGPPAQEVFAPIPVEELRPVLEEASRWHREDPDGGSDAAANVARAERFLRDGRWVTKREAV